MASFLSDPANLRRGVKSVDWFGILLLAATLTTMQVVLERGQEKNWFDSRMIVLGSVFCIFSTLTLMVWEMKTAEPVINFRVLRNVPLSLGSVIGLIFGIALFGTTFILPQFTQELLGYSAYQAGLVLAPRAVMLMIAMPVAGILYRYVDARALMLAGAAVVLWSFYSLAHLSLQAGYSTLVPMLLIMGTGLPFVFVTVSTVSLSTVNRSDMTDATSLFTLARRNRRQHRIRSRGDAGGQRRAGAQTLPGAKRQPLQSGLSRLPENPIRGS